MSPFEQLDPSIQARLVRAAGGNSVSIMERHQLVGRMHQGDLAMSAACLSIDKEAIFALIALGCPINPDPKSGYFNAPLGMMVGRLGAEDSSSSRQEALLIIDALLAQGADPNALLNAQSKRIKLHGFGPSTQRA